MVLRGKFMGINAYIKNKNISTVHLKELDKEQKQSIPCNVSRREKTKISTEINEAENRKTEKKSINLSWFFENIF